MNASCNEALSSRIVTDRFIYRLVSIIIVLMAGAALFSTLAVYDDEGYVMMTLKTYMGGDRLYGKTHTQYGPAYYFLTAPIHEFCRWPLTQTGVRIKTLIVWMLAVGCCYSIVKRMSGSSLAAIATACLAAVHLDKLALEPGHPQEIVLLATLGLLVILSRGVDYPDRSRRNSMWLAGGMLAAIAGMTKMNCGLVLAVPLLLTAAIVVAKQPSHLISRIGLILLSSFAPLLVAWHGRSDASTILWAIIIAASAAYFVNTHCRLLTQTKPKNRDLENCNLAILANYKPIFLVIAAGGGMAGLLIGLSMLQEVSLTELWFGLISQHANFSESFFQPIPQSLSSWLCVAATILRLVLFPKVGRTQKALWIIVGLLVLSLAITAWRPLVHGLEPRGAGSILIWCGPIWIALFFSRTDVFSIPRFCFGMIAILSPLIAFPVSGTQVQLATLPAMLGLGIVLGKAMNRWLLGESRHIEVVPTTNWGVANHRRLVLIGAMIPLILGTIGHVARYATGTPLELRGSAFMRLSGSVVAEQQAIVEAIERSEADHLFFEGHNNNRFYFWTNKRPLTAANPTFWPRMLTVNEESALSEAIGRQTKLCIVRAPSYEAIYGTHATKIREQLADQWQLQSSIGGWQIGELKEVGQ